MHKTYPGLAAAPDQTGARNYYRLTSHRAGKTGADPPTRYHQPATHLPEFCRPAPEIFLSQLKCEPENFSARAGSRRKNIFRDRDRPGINFFCKKNCRWNIRVNDDQIRSYNIPISARTLQRQAGPRPPRK